MEIRYTIEKVDSNYIADDPIVTRTIRCIQTIDKAHDAQVSGILTINGFLCSSSCDQTIKIWKLDENYNSELVRTLNGHENAVYALSLIHISQGIVR